MTHRPLGIRALFWRFIDWVCQPKRALDAARLQKRVRDSAWKEIEDRLFEEGSFLAGRFDHQDERVGTDDLQRNRGNPTTGT